MQLKPDPLASAAIIENRVQVVPVARNADSEGPVPSAWRPTFSAIVDAFVAGDFSLARGIPGVLPVPPETSEQVQEYIAEYGQTLVPLPAETWTTSVCIWVNPHWDVLVDLYTQAEGRSDMVLQCSVHESNGEFTYEIHMVYVP